MQQPTAKTPLWLQSLKESWTAESLGADIPGLVSKSDAELWALWRQADKLGANLENFDSWRGLYERSFSGRSEALIAHHIGLLAKVGEVVAASVKPMCNKCGGVLIRRRWRDLAREAQENFPNLRVVCAEGISLPQNEAIRRAYTLSKYLDIFGSERVIIDGRVCSRSELESDVLDSPLYNSEKWHRELKIVLPVEPAENWVGSVIGILDRQVAFRHEVTPGAMCSACGKQGDFTDFSLNEIIFSSKASSWRFGSATLNDLAGWSVGEGITRLNLDRAGNFEQLKSFGILEFPLFGEISQLSRGDAFTLWCYVQLMLKPGADLLAFDVPAGKSSAVRNEIVSAAAAAGIRIFTDSRSSQRFFIEQIEEPGAKGTRYRCQWTRMRGCLARRLGVFEDLVAPFFETEQGRQVGVTAGRFSNVGCKSCLEGRCASCGGTGVQERYLELNSFGMTLKEFMQTPIGELVSRVRGGVQDVLSRLVELGFGGVALGSISPVRESPAWFGYEVYVADLMQGTVRGGDLSEIKGLL